MIFLIHQSSWFLLGELPVNEIFVNSAFMVAAIWITEFIMVLFFSLVTMTRPYWVGGKPKVL